MKKKHSNSFAREIALQSLYQIELGKKSIEEVMELKWMSNLPERKIIDYSKKIVCGVYESFENNINYIIKYSRKDITQISTIVQGIMQIGLWELKNAQIDPVVIIDDLLELTRKFDGEESVAFVNATLDSIRKEICEIKK